MVSDSGSVPMTYQELAAARGISLLSARRMVMRYRWPKMLGNDGVAKVWVPVDAIPDEPPESTVPASELVEVKDENRRLVEWLMQSSELLNRRVEAAEERANRAEARLDQAEARASAAEFKVIQLHEEHQAILRQCVSAYQSIVLMCCQQRSWWSRVRGKYPTIPLPPLLGEISDNWKPTDSATGAEE